MEIDKKVNRYVRIIDQLKDLLSKSDNFISKCATIAALLHHKMNYYFWTGFYYLNNGKLQVGPYQGSLACQELEKNKGVCWECINKGSSIIVPDVDQFPEHIACDSRSKSEIVIPIFNKYNKIVGVLDIDSKEFDSFDETDKKYLEIIIKMLYN